MQLFKNFTATKISLLTRQIFKSLQRWWPVVQSIVVYRFPTNYTTCIFIVVRVPVYHSVIRCFRIRWYEDQNVCSLFIILRKSIFPIQKRVIRTDSFVLGITSTVGKTFSPNEHDKHPTWIIRIVEAVFSILVWCMYISMFGFYVPYYNGTKQRK